MRKFSFAVLCALLALGTARADIGVVKPEAGSGLTPASAPRIGVQGDLDYWLLRWGEQGWTGISPRYAVNYQADPYPGLLSLQIPEGYLLEKVLHCQDTGLDVYRIQRVCAATADEPGFNLDTFENNWEHPRYVLYPGEESPYAYSNIFAFAASDIHWTQWGARATYYPLPGGGETDKDLRQPMLQVQSVIIAHDVPYGTPSDQVRPQISMWDPAGDFFYKVADEVRYNYGIGEATADDVRTGEIVSNWTPSVIWRQDQIAEAPTGVPTYRFEYNLGGIYSFDEMGDNPVLHTNEVAFFRVLKTDIARDLNDVYDKWPHDAGGNRLDPTGLRPGDKVNCGFDPYEGDVNDLADPYNPGFTVVNDPVRPWVVQHDPFRGTDQASDPGCDGWDAVAGTEGFYDPDPSKYVPAVTSSVTIAVSGRGTLKWKNLIKDPSGANNAAIWVSVDGGEPTRILVGDMGEWSDQRQEFLFGAPDSPHTVTISFVNNAAEDPSGMAYGYLDNVEWEPPIYTTNIHGLLKIRSPFANTIIPAPWKGYTRDGSPTNDIRVDRLVKPRNLTDGDMLLQYANGGVYKAWILEKNTATGEGVWTPMPTVAQKPLVGGGTNEVESLYVKPAGDETQRRGYGLWLVRNRPKDEAGNVIPFYLYGQWMTGVETVTIGGIDADDVAIKYADAQYGVVHDTMLADPDCTRESVINHHAWTGFDVADTVILNTDLKQSLYCFRRERSKRSGGGYYDGWWVWGADGYTTNGISTPPGVGFWYERRAAGDMTLTWAGPDQYPGEGRDLDVWIVDHADAGDGKTHLAFKFDGGSAPATITEADIKKLFEAGCIRYLHTTGATQAEGKAEMDRLSANPLANARPVLKLRNDTGVNTKEELAKGWIWVTVDAPDGTNAADPAHDGTGDTNGAGDLWRIVIVRGLW